MSSTNTRAAQNKLHDKRATKKRRAGSKKKSSARTTADSWRSDARALGKEKQYQDLVCRPPVYPDVVNPGEPPVEQPGTQAAGTVAWNPTPPGALLVCNLVLKGDDVTNRRGQKISLKSLYISGVLRSPLNFAGNNESQGNKTTAGDGPRSISNAKAVWDNNLRLVVVYDEDPKNITGSYTVAQLVKDIFGVDTNAAIKPQPEASAGTTAVSDTYYPGALQNMRGQGRFHVLADERMTYPACTVSANAAQHALNGLTQDIIIKRYIKLGGISTSYRSQSNPMTLDDIAKGALYAMWITDHSGTELGASQLNPVFEGVVRLRFDEKN